MSEYEPRPGAMTHAELLEALMLTELRDASHRWREVELEVDLRRARESGRRHLRVVS